MCLYLASCVCLPRVCLSVSLFVSILLAVSVCLSVSAVCLYLASCVCLPRVCWSIMPPPPPSIGAEAPVIPTGLCRGRAGGRLAGIQTVDTANPRRGLGSNQGGQSPWADRHWVPPASPARPIDTHRSGSGRSV